MPEIIEDLAIDLGGSVVDGQITLSVEAAHELMKIPDGIADWGRTRCRRALARQAARSRNWKAEAKRAYARRDAANARAREAEEPMMIARAQREAATAVEQAASAVERIMGAIDNGRRPRTVELTVEELEGHLAQAHADGVERGIQRGEIDGGSEIKEEDRLYASGYRATIWGD